MTGCPVSFQFPACISALADLSKPHFKGSAFGGDGLYNSQKFLGIYNIGKSFLAVCCSHFQLYDFFVQFISFTFKFNFKSLEYLLGSLLSVKTPITSTTENRCISSSHAVRMRLSSKAEFYHLHPFISPPSNLSLFCSSFFIFIFNSILRLN